MWSPISFSMNTVCIQPYIEYEIGLGLHSQITVLRNACFPDCQCDRSYFKQLPHFRLLAFDGARLVGHLGVDHRMMSFNHVPHSVFGIIDLCVQKKYRNQGIAYKLLSAVEETAIRAGIDGLVLIAQDPRLYKRFGFVGVDAICQWLRIDEHTNFGVAVENIANEVMVKPLCPVFDVSGPIDFLGYMF